MQAAAGADLEYKCGNAREKKLFEGLKPSPGQLAAISVCLGHARTTDGCISSACCCQDVLGLEPENIRQVALQIRHTSVNP